MSVLLPGPVACANLKSESEPRACLLLGRPYLSSMLPLTLPAGLSASKELKECASLELAEFDRVCFVLPPPPPSDNKVQILILPIRSTVVYCDSGSGAASQF